MAFAFAALRLPHRTNAFALQTLNLTRAKINLTGQKPTGEKNVWNILLINITKGKNIEITK